MKIVRWLLTLPAAVAGWYMGFIVALLIQQLSELLCPAEHIVSGKCQAPWSSFAMEFALAAGSLLCGSLAVLLPALMAPTSRLMVARLAYAAGLACSVYWLLHGFWIPVAWAALAGAATVWRIQEALIQRPPGIIKVSRFFTR